MRLVGLFYAKKIVLTRASCIYFSNTGIHTIIYAHSQIYFL